MKYLRVRSIERQRSMSTIGRTVFVSYCHADAAWLDRLKIHLRPLVRQGEIDVWDDSRISPGQEWREQIGEALARAGIAILLVSADFLASDFILSNELPLLLHRAAKGGLLVVPLIVSPCLLEEHQGLSRYQSANRPDRPLSGMSPTEVEATLASLGRSVGQYFRVFERSTTNAPASSPIAGPSGQLIRTTASGSSPPNSPDTPLVVDRPLNLGFDGSAPDGIPIGWFNSFGHVSGVSTDYRIRLCPRSEDRAAGMCAVLEKATPQLGQFGSLMQRCRGRFLAGRTIRLVGELRTEGVSDWAGMWLRADAEEQPNLFFDNMSRRPVVGTTNWTSYFIDAPLPANVDWLNYGVVLSGTGALFVDNIQILAWRTDGGWESV